MAWVHSAQYNTTHRVTSYVILLPRCAEAYYNTATMCAHACTHTEERDMASTKLNLYY